MILRHAGAFGGRRSRAVGDEKPTTLLVPPELSHQQEFRALSALQLLIGRGQTAIGRQRPDAKQPVAPLLLADARIKVRRIAGGANELPTGIAYSR